jgi:glycosyltransferase involved in cell wall biosynthesis
LCDFHYDVVMLALNDLAHDGRVRREAAALARAGWRVLVLGTQRSDGPLPDDERIQGFEVQRVRYENFGVRLWWPWRWLRHGLQAVQLIRALRSVSPQAYHAHDLPALMLVSLARRRKTRLVYDSHELYLFQSPRRIRWADAWHRANRRLFFALERYLARRADAVIVVSEPCARILRRWYRLKTILVVRNCIDPPPTNAHIPVAIRARTGEGSHLIVHTGDLTNRGRCLSELVEAFRLLDPDVNLVFLGQGEDQSMLEQQVVQSGLEDRVEFVPPVPPAEVAATIQVADAAVVALRPDSWHIRSTLPNKLFEAIAAGLPVVVSKTFALARIVRAFDLGILCDTTDPGAIALALRQIVEPQHQHHYRARVRMAQAGLNWQTEAAKLCHLYRTLL